MLAVACCLFSRCGCTCLLFDVNALSVVCCLMFVMCCVRVLLIVGVVRRCLLCVSLSVEVLRVVCCLFLVLLYGVVYCWVLLLLSLVVV